MKDEYSLKNTFAWAAPPKPIKQGFIQCIIRDKWNAPCGRILLRGKEIISVRRINSENEILNGPDTTTFDLTRQQGNLLQKNNGKPGEKYPDWLDATEG